MEYIKSLFSKTNQIKQVGFEDVKYAIRHTDNYLLMNTLSVIDQDCLIYNTVTYITEEKIINDMLDNNYIDNTTIILYGKHSADATVNEKYSQLITLGFKHVYIYGGGLFEWLLLQDIYSASEFPTTSKCKDLLKYRAPLALKSAHFPRLLHK